MDIKAIIVVLYLAISKCLSNVEQIDCTESARKPSDETLNQMYNNWLGLDNDIHSTFDLIPHMYKMRHKDIILDALPTVWRQRINGRAKCHKKLKRKSENLMDMSLCPWYVEMNVDKSRYPEIMANARCTCKHCYNFDGIMPDRSKRIGKPRCKEIKQKFKVLRVEKNSRGAPVCQRNDTNTFLYKNSYEEVTIGCTCALKRDRTVKDIPTKTGS
ncbi:uncharacterized protein LOC123534557 isoform X2 [Mercenaria mercenaria]|uniref:uncharacterized protein LOC123534557 isoform X2 n=1 Tax=Mercenaria mercenaria TaxID=6596 RepID=UPI00234E9F7E|nr:uncharacterized protein LOC123534557 isoform X2 [Mercenaria mercenaria]